MSVNKWD
ncbi:hypothetical protein CCHL11_05449 [Colletotrichum chlorophyti]|nr:hypothetical protein CCHL11_05449 [Colletotrichum chlorophyti]